MNKKNKLLLTFFMVITLLFPIQASAFTDSNNALQSLKATGKAFTEVVKKVSPAVVFIKVEKEVSTQTLDQSLAPFSNDDFFNYFFGFPFENDSQRRNYQQRTPQKKRKEIGQGSGFIISKDGYILTNNHVVGDADIVKVTLKNGETYTAKLIGTDPQSDVAVIKIKGHNFPYIELGDSDVLEVGEWVLAIGNPFGLSNTLTAGIVSAKGRSEVGIANYENFIQTDAAINPGNSGGPLINLEGKVIGINTAIYSKSGGYMGIGFAIPINMAQKIKNQLIEKGTVTRGFLGVMIQELSEDLAKSFNLQGLKGVLVSQVVKNSPAEKAGLKQGDIITRYNGQQVERVGSFRNSISLFEPGTKVELDIIRKQEKKNITVVIGKLKDKDQLAAADSAKSSFEKLGLHLQEITPELENQYNLTGRRGLLVSQVTDGSLAEMGRIQKGDIILEIDQHPINTIAEFKKLFRKAEKRGLVLLLIQTKNNSRYISIRLDN